MDVKKCTKCGEQKPVDAFYKQHRRKDGRMNLCKICHNAHGRAWRAANKERVASINRQYRLDNKEQIAAKRRAWRQANAEAEAARDLRRRRASPERHRNRTSNWAANNPDAVNSKSALRRARSKQAQPNWLTPHERQMILLKYKEARVMSTFSGIPHEVDHMVPINGDGVCGLHVPWNLRVIPMRENRKKAKKISTPLATRITML